MSESVFLTKDTLVEFLRDNLTLDHETTSEYTGDMDGTGNLYTTYHVIKLVLDGEVIGTVSL